MERGTLVSMATLVTMLACLAMLADARTTESCPRLVTGTCSKLTREQLLAKEDGLYDLYQVTDKTPNYDADAVKQMKTHVASRRRRAAEDQTTCGIRQATVIRWTSATGWCVATDLMNFACIGDCKCTLAHYYFTLGNANLNFKECCHGKKCCEVTETTDVHLTFWCPADCVPDYCLTAEVPKTCDCVTLGCA